MAFSDPQSTQNPAVGVKATAALLNVWDADQDFLHDPSTAPGAEAVRVTDQTITGTQTINWTSEGWDVGTTHDNITNNERITVPTGGDGLYLAFFQARCLSVSTPQTMTLRIRKNGTTTLAKKVRTAGTTAVPVACSCIWFGSLAAGDYLTGTILEGSSMDADVGLRCALSATWLGRGVQSESFLYTSLADIMATPYNGQVVPAAFGDQVRENLMALWVGETFKVSNTAAQTSGILYTYNTIDWATPNVVTTLNSSINYQGGTVTLPSGVWLIGFCADQSDTPVSLRGGAGVPASGAFARDNTANLVGVLALPTGLNFVNVLPDATPSTSVSEMRTELWGYQLSDL